MKEEVSNRPISEDADGYSTENAQTSDSKDDVCSAPIPMQLALPAPLYTSNYNCENGNPSFSVGYSVLDENEHRYVGLVNQAMTCYLNSLLQSLYMTPEFRNIIYSLERKRSPRDIPFQLQKLFIQLQTSDRMSLSTVDLTNAFGWERDGSFDQHDVQELFRLVVEALEKRLAKTDSKGCVENLFKGVFYDQIKCLKCKNMRRNEVDFLDLSLAVRPFGASSSHKTVEEAIEEFIKPEILNGSNQYHCDACNSKEDAEKGLAIKEFPYLLAIQLKRFGFDANTFSRIKLNDRIAFPDYLDLNKFIYQEPKPRMSYAAAASAGANKADKKCAEEVFEPESRENSSKGWWPKWSSAGMLFSSTEDDGNWLNESVDSESVKKLLQNGPYIYELFSVLVHQGSAAGGHYFALIKNMDQQKWFDFNDSTVSNASAGEVRRTFGDSCGIAYVLMYRRVDPQKNEKFLRSSEVPLHISQLLSEIEEEKSTIYVNVACNHKNYVANPHCEIAVNNRMTYDSLIQKMREMHPDVQASAEVRLIQCDSKWRMEAILDTETPLLSIDEDCRRIFNRPQAFIIFDVKEGTHFFEFPSQSPVRCDMLTADVHVVNLTDRTVNPAKRIAFEKTTTVSELRGTMCAIPDVRPCDPLNMRIAYDLNNSEISLWCDDDDNITRMYYLDSNVQLYLDCGDVDKLTSDRKLPFNESAMYALITKRGNIDSPPADPFKNWSNCTSGLNCDGEDDQCEEKDKTNDPENVQIERDENESSQADATIESANDDKCNEIALCSQPYRRVEKGLRIRVMSECEQ